MSFDNEPFLEALLPSPHVHALAPHSFKEVIDLAHLRLCTRMESPDAGNELSQDHRVALYEVLTGLSRLAAGRKRERIAYHLPTGMGKTLSVTYWCAAAVELGVVGPGLGSVAVATSQVEALCTLKRDMMAAGVPEYLIGLRHSYEHDPKIKAGETPPDGYRPPDNMASLPADSDAADRPILLCSHARVKGKGAKEVFTFEGHRRNLLIWDETLFKTETWAVPWGRLHFLALGMPAALGADHPTSTFLAHAVQEIEAELRRQADKQQPKSVRLNMTPEEREIHRIAIKSVTGRGGAVQDPGGILSDFMDMAGEELAIAETQTGDALIAYQPSIDDELDAVVVLDASYQVRELCKLDKTMRPGLDLDTDLKTYENVTLKRFTVRSGREATEGDLKNPGGFMATMLIDVAKEYPDENVLCFTFTKKRKRDREGCEDKLRHDLKLAGIDPDALVNGWPRISFLTFGSETSRNDLKHCTRVVFAGMQHRDHGTIAADMAGQSGNLLLAPSAERVQSVVTSEVVHTILQGANRAACRVVKNGKAGKTTIYLPMWRDDFEGPLRRAMPGIQWEVVSAPAKPVDPNSLSGQTAEAIAAYLRALPADVTKVRTATIKAAMSTPPTPKVWEIGASAAEALATGWRRGRMSWERVPP